MSPPGVRLVIGLLVASCGRLDFDPLAGDAAGAACIGDVSGAGFHACVVRNDGDVYCWGVNREGELGDGTQVQRPDPVPVSTLVDAVSVAAGEDHTCVVRTDQSVACWGKNDRGQIGDGTLTQSLLPQRVTIDSVVEIATGQTHTCVRRSDGSMWCWGANDKLALGSPGAGTESVVPVEVAGFIGADKVVVGDNSTCATRSGIAYCWGTALLLGDDSGLDRSTPGPVPLPGQVIDISAGCHDHTCALVVGGQAYCWGNNTFGQLGNGGRALSKTPVLVSGPAAFVQISVGAIQTCARTGSGEVWCWGAAKWSLIGDNLPDDALVPRRVPLPEPVDDVVAGCARTCARRGDRVWCWGSDDRLGFADLGTGRPIHAVAMPCP